MLVWGLLVLATVLLFVSSLTVWSKRQLLDDDAWANSSSQLLANDEVRGAVSQTLVDRLFERDDIVAQLRARLPEQAQGAGQAAANAAGADALARHQQARSHAGVVKVLEGKISAGTETSRPRTETSRSISDR